MKIQKIAIYLFLVSAILLAIGFVMHPKLTTEGMLQDLWVPDHYIILVSLILVAFSINLLTIPHSSNLNPNAWIGFVLLNLSFLLFIGIVYFELFLIPILAVDLPELFQEGLRIGPLKLVLPLTALFFVVGHLFYTLGMSQAKILPKIPWILLTLFSIPVAFKPVLPDIVAMAGAIGYGLSAIYFIRKADL